MTRATVITREQILARNSIERLKAEKFPLDILAELPALARRGYEGVAEEDIVRLQWYGLYHDKPKTGSFMLRVKIAGGVLTPARLRTIGEVAVQFGRGYGELTTRQNVQLHWVELGHLPEVFEALGHAGFNQAGGCGDTVRNITGCPVSGIDPGETFDVSPVLAEAARFFYGNRAYSDLPRKHKITLAACPHQCNLPEIHCIALVGTRQDDREGFGLRVGGGLSTVPRLARDLGVFVQANEAIEVLRAVIDVWQEAPKYRLSRVKARLKFMMDDIGPAEYRRSVEERLGRRLPDGQAPAPLPGGHHAGVHRQKQAGLSFVAVPVSGGLINGDQMRRVADLAEAVAAQVRLTREQNFIVVNVPDDALPKVIRELEATGFPLGLSALRARSIACTGSPLCN
ncbi:MAG: nitrite/sulfite reductase, partial [Gemmatimonadota bacterium]